MKPSRIISLPLPSVHVRWRLALAENSVKVTRVQAQDAYDSYRLVHVLCSDLDAALTHILQALLGDFGQARAALEPKLTAANRAFHFGGPGIRPRSQAAVQRVRQAMTELEQLCRDYAKAYEAILAICATEQRSPPGHQLPQWLQQAVADVRSGAVPQPVDVRSIGSTRDRC